MTRRVTKEGVPRNDAGPATAEEKTERAIRGRKQRDFGPFYNFQ